MSVIYLNARSLFNKLDDLSVLITDKEPDLILITETWNNPSISDAMLNIPGYYIENELRKDRSDTANGIGGGLIVYAREGISIRPIHTQCNFNQFCKFVVQSSGKDDDIEFTLYYRSPNSSSENNAALESLISRSGKNNIIIGDLNMPEINWDTYTGPNKYSDILDTLQAKNMTQIVDFPTHNRGNILDAVFTNIPEQVLDIAPVGYLGKSDHLIISLELNFGPRINKSDESYPDWSKADHRGLSDYLNNQNWSSALQNKNAEESWWYMRSIIHTGMSNFVPSKCKRSINCPPWFNNNIRNLSRRKQKMWDQHRVNRTPATFLKYKEAEKKCKSAISRAKKKYEKKLADTPNLRPFNAYIRKKTKSKSTIGPLKVNNKLIDNDLDMATALNQFFTSVFTQEDTTNIPTPTNRPRTIDLSNMTFSPATVEEALSNLKPNSAPGPDKIPGKLLNEHRHSLSIPLAILFNKSMSSGHVPADWKCANITPIYKKGKKCEAGNYRPISLTSICGKVMESLIKQEIMDYLITNSLLNDSQHGFMPKKSTTSNLLEFFEHITRDVDDGIPVDVVYLDFAKAFDKVPHQRLMAKIRAHGITGNIAEWISSWLRDRKQRTVLNGATSDWQSVLSGVPQGSVLGPILFLIFINDLDEAAISIKYRSKFADDTKIGHQITNQDSHAEMQQALNGLHEWSVKWGLKFNVDKCHLLHFGRNNPAHQYTMNGQLLPQKDMEKDVGVCISTNLKPSHHCAEVARKAQAILYQISRSFHFRDRNVFVKLYKQYVRCILEYAAPVWSPWLTGDIETLEKVQRKMVNMIPGLGGNSYEQKLAEINLDKLSTRRVRFDMINLFKTIHGYTVTPVSNWFTLFSNPSQVTRTSNCPLNIIPRNSKTDMRKNFFSNRCATVWNNLPMYVKNSPSISCFKSRYDKHTRSNQQAT